MRINSLTVKNFKGFEEATFEFPERFTLIVGENGTGKTSVLEGLALVFGFAIDWQESGAADYIKRVIGDNATAFNQRDDVIRPFRRTLRSELGTAIRFEPQSPSYSVVQYTDQWNKPGVRGIGEAAPDKNGFCGGAPIPLFSYYSSGRLPETRHIAPTDLNVSMKRSTSFGYQGCMSGLFIVKNILSWLRDEQYAALQEGKESVLFRAVTDAMVSCLPGAKKITYVIREQDVLIEFESGNVQPFRNLSDGQRMLLWMVADIAYRAAWLNPQLEDRVLQETDGIVLIDELDLHLHPKWQRDVIDNLKRTFPKVQFIATSHSPFLIQSLQPGELLSLDGDPPIDYSNSGLEEIARFIQGVDVPHTSQRYEDQKAAAKRYFTMLREGRSRNDQELLEAKSNLDSLTAHFSDNPAAEAFFELQRAAQTNSNRANSSQDDDGHSDGPQSEATSP